MLALIFDGKEPRLTDVPKPRTAKGEALIAVHAAGVCRTDLEILKGYMDFRGVMGHEFVGTVVEGPKRWIDRRVVGEINCVCGRCDLCRSGLRTHCRERTVLGIEGRDGVFAEYVSLPVRNLHHVPAGVSDAEAVFVEPLAAAFQIVRQVKFNDGADVVVLGDGRLGQLVARVLRLYLSRLLLVGRHPGRLEAAEKAGIQTQLARQFLPRGRTDIVVDATGSHSGFELAMRTVRPRGTIVLKSTFTAKHGCNLSPLVINEVTVLGSRCGPFPEAIKALAGGSVDVSALVSRQVGLDRGLEALVEAKSPKNIKVIIDVRR